MVARIALATVLVVAVPDFGQAQSDDPAVSLCEAREKPKADPTYRRVDASLHNSAVDLVFETGTGGAVKRLFKRCHFERTASGAWQFLDEKKLPELAACDRLSDQVTALIRANKLPEARQYYSATENCRDVRKASLNRQIFSSLALTVNWPGYTYPIPPDATRLQP